MALEGTKEQATIDDQIVCMGDLLPCWNNAYSFSSLNFHKMVRKFVHCIFLKLLYSKKYDPT